MTFAIVALVALATMVPILEGSATGDAAKIFNVHCFDFCKEKACNKIPISDDGRLYPCLNHCLNECWGEYDVKAATTPRGTQ